MAEVAEENIISNGKTEEVSLSEEKEKVGEKLSVKRESEETNNDAVVKKPKLDLEPPNELETKIIRQIEYYFGDNNLTRDKFMIEKISEENGWIPFSVMLTFKRLAALTTDKDVIIKALSKSETQLVEVNEEKTKMRRRQEFPIPENNEERRKDLLSRTAYVKGFPVTIELEDILKWFEDKQNVENVLKRSYLDKATKKFMFKGSVFVTFKTVDDCKNFIEGGPYFYDTNKVELIVKWQEKYIEEKRKEREDYKLEKAALKSNKDDIEIKDLKESSIVHLSGINPETVFDDIKSAIIEKYEIEPRYVDFKKGDTEAFVRLEGTDTASKLIDKMKEVKLEINESELTGRLLEGDELKEHLLKVKNEMMSRRKFKNNKGRKNKGGKRK